MLVFGAAIVLQLLLACQAAKPADISYQIHSYNDLREWRQVLMKGATWFKIDPTYTLPVYCQQQSNVLNSTNGCFLLSHNTPFIGKTNYNTTDDVLALIASPEYAQWFQTGNKITIALCLKTQYDPCENNTNSRRLLLAFDDFFARAQALLAGNVNVEFILDGSLTPSNRSCLETRYAPWVATWIINSDPLDALESNSLTKGYNRYQVNNMPQNIFNPLWNLEFLQDLAFGKFLFGQYPFLFWEPSDQSIISSVANQYKNGKEHQNLGFRFAINIDPIMFDVYSGSISGRAVNKQLPISGSVPYLSGSYLLVYNGSCVVNAHIDVTSGNLTDPVCLPVPAGDLSAFSTTNFMGWQFSLVSYPNGQYVILNGTDVFATGSIGVSTYFNTINIFNLGSALGVVLASQYQSQVNIEAYLFELSDHTLQLLGNGILFPQVAPNSLDIGFFGEDMLMVYGTTQNTVFAAVLTLNIANGLELKVAPWEFGTGSYPSVALWQSNQTSEMYVLVLHGNGFCWNSDNNNKQNNPAVCDQEPSPTSNVLVYTFGTYDQWMTAGSAFQTITPCHPEILTGMYDMGNNPSADLQFVDGALWAMSAHAGIPSGTSDPAGCGLANSYDGIVYDAFKLPM